MLDAFVSRPSHPWEASANACLDNLNANVAASDGITRASANKGITAGGYCQEAINISEAKPAPGDSWVMPEMPLAAEKAWDIHKAGDSTIEVSASSGDSLIGEPVSPVVEEGKGLTLELLGCVPHERSTLLTGNTGTGESSLGAFRCWKRTLLTAIFSNSPAQIPPLQSPLKPFPNCH